MVSKTFFEINEDHTINQAIVDVDRPAMCTKFRGLNWGIAGLHSQVIKNKKKSQPFNKLSQESGL